MTTFPVAVPSVPVIDSVDPSRHPDDGAHDSALDTDDLPPLPPLALHPVTQPVAVATGTQRRPSELLPDSSFKAYELKIAPTYLSERPRRPSAFRIDSNVETIVDTGPAGKYGGGIEPDTPAKENHVYPPTYESNVASLTILPPLHFSGREEEISAEQKKIYQRREWLYFGTICWCLFLQGWNDGTVGPLLPVIQRDYNLNFEIAALLFVFNCIGFILGAVSNVYLNQKFGFGKVVLFGSLFQVVSYTIQSPQPPFPVMVFGFALAGYGMSLQNAQANGFVACLREHKSVKLNVLHAAYGIGAFASPLVATYFSGVRHWSFHYLISTALAVSNTVAAGMVFRGRTQEDLFATIGQSPPVTTEMGGQQGTNVYKAIMAIKSVHFLAIFALLYIGIEVTLGGWIVTFIIRERDGGQSAGYISSGFFGGITLGRILLIWVSQKVGEHRVIFLYSILAIALEVTIWVVPNIYENAVAVSLIGLLLGPMFPILVGHTTRIMPQWILTGTIGWISGIGMSGSAMLPFITGLLAGRYGIRSLQPFLVAMMCTMVGMWALVPTSPRRRAD